MYALALATDYDETLADHGAVTPAALEAIRKLKDSGRKLILVTGRELPDLKRVFAEHEIFDRIVAENGALLYTPATRKSRQLAPPPPPKFVDRLRQRGVEPLYVGETIVATLVPNETIVLEEIRDLGLELEIIFNKGAVMVLPSGLNKATGLLAALEELELSPHNVVGIGDAENDHALLRTVGYGVAVANALPTVKETADRSTRAARGAGVAELVGLVLDKDAALMDTERQRVEVGADAAGVASVISPYGGCSLIAGTSGIGKSTLATLLTERFFKKGYQFCVLDPEGDYSHLENVVVVGDADAAPNLREILDLLEKPTNNVAVNMLGLKTDERPDYFARLLPELASLRARKGRPHWLVIDEAHHLLPSARVGNSFALPNELPATILVTVHPDLVSKDVLQKVEVVMALGPEAGAVFDSFSQTVGVDGPKGIVPLSEQQILFWDRASGRPAKAIEVDKPKQARKRHKRKYAEGDLGDSSFYFRGPDGAMRLKAQNLMMFLHIAEGVDDATWEHHLRAGDYSKWFGGKVKDKELAAEARAIEDNEQLAPGQSRAAIADAVRSRYTGTTG
ncbi:phosphoglycolate phosphatase (plasmid) [Aminobacter sp. Y103A]|uniref:HAD-IIB family hydrolase n=1 Tax=Aminobacter sp. Y103A TaxID=1870862 RepID=UPI002574824E|nr:HAD-IIB family hydrolase [Aminobacter sp. SS-2016]BBD41178.1 phosphoglycolate phosphatase [Aminobacter sp. SS-2016]